MEISVPQQDRELLKRVAANLRAGGETAENTRNLLNSTQNPYVGLNFNEFLEAAPSGELELDRSKEMTSDTDL